MTISRSSCAAGHRLRLSAGGGDIYFDTSKLQRYYIFNDHNEEDLAVGVREGVEEDTNKRNKSSFASTLVHQVQV